MTHVAEAKNTTHAIRTMPSCVTSRETPIAPSASARQYTNAGWRCGLTGGAGASPRTVSFAREASSSTVASNGIWMSSSMSVIAHPPAP